MTSVLVRAAQSIEYQVLALWGAVIGLLGALIWVFRRISRLEKRLMLNS